MVLDENVALARDFLPESLPFLRKTMVFCEFSVFFPLGGTAAHKKNKKKSENWIKYWNSSYSVEFWTKNRSRLEQNIEIPRIPLNFEEKIDQD